jgi:hypothetical protein
MKTRDTSEVIRRFNQAFEEHNAALFEDLVAPDCVIESIQPAPNGTRYEGYDVQSICTENDHAHERNEVRK